VASILVATSVGFGPGVTWAFLAGLTANVLSGEPLGSVPLSLLAAVGLTVAAAPALARVPLAYPVLATFAGSIVADAIMLVSQQLIRGGTWPGVPLEVVIRAAALNAALAALALIPIRLVRRRRERAEARW
jgi:cell shape-determining protein MreD